MKRRKRHDQDGLYKCCGCQRRQWPSCGHAYWFSFKPARQPQIRKRLHVLVAGYSDLLVMFGTAPITERAEAVKPRDAVRVRLQSGAAPSAARRFGDVADLFSKATCPGKTDYYVEAAKKIALSDGRPLETRLMGAVTTADIDDVQAAWRKRPGGKQGGKVGPHRVLRRLRALWTWAIRKEYTDRTPFGAARGGLRAARPRARPDPAARRRRRGPPAPGRRRFRLTAPARFDYHGLWTGCRKGELLSLQWSQVRDGEFTVLASKAKTRVERTIAALGPVRDILKHRRLGPDGRILGPGCYVFGDETGRRHMSVKTALARACKKASTKDLTFHDLRHEFGSRYHLSGATLSETQQAATPRSR